MDPARVNLPLTTAEKSQLRAAAISEERSDGAMARQIYLLGAQIYFSVEGAVAHEK